MDLLNALIHQNEVNSKENEPLDYYKKAFDLQKSLFEL